MEYTFKQSGFVSIFALVFSVMCALTLYLCAESSLLLVREIDRHDTSEKFTRAAKNFFDQMVITPLLTAGQSSQSFRVKYFSCMHPDHCVLQDRNITYYLKFMHVQADPCMRLRASQNPGVIYRASIEVQHENFKKHLHLAQYVFFPSNIALPCKKEERLILSPLVSEVSIA